MCLTITATFLFLWNYSFRVSWRSHRRSYVAARLSSGGPRKRALPDPSDRFDLLLLSVFKYANLPPRSQIAARDERPRICPRSISSSRGIPLHFPHHHYIVIATAAPLHPRGIFSSSPSTFAFSQLVRTIVRFGESRRSGADRPFRRRPA